MKKIILAVFVVLAALGGWYYATDGTFSLVAAQKKAKNAAIDAVANNAKPEEVAALALKAIELKQGENGIELWRLKADWGNMRRSGNTMELEKPRFSYYMPPDNDEVTIVSDKGDVNQETQVIQFMENVVSTFDERTLTSTRMIYEGKARVVTFPEGAAIKGADVAGTAAHVVWRLGDKVIDATGGVDLTFTSERELLPAPPRPTSGQQTPPAPGKRSSARSSTRPGV